MSTLQYAFLSLVILTAALEAKKILRAQEGAPTTGRFIVKLSMDTSSERFNDLAKDIESEADDNQIHTKVDGQFAKIISAKLSEQALELIKDKDNVEYIEEETLATIALEWHLDRINQRNLPLDGSFSLSETGNGVDIYILDTGIRYTHSEFGGRAQSSFDAFGGDGSDCQGHGTHVAGLAGGSTYGAATDATLYSVRVLDCGGSGSYAGVIAGVDHAATQISNNGRPGIISMSLGGPSSQGLNDAIENAVAAGAHVSVAAGNENQDACNVSPAGAPSAITVGATDINDNRASFSNFGTCVDIFAPGVSIRSASHNDDSSSVVFSGTSMACPITSGVMATLLEADSSLSPAALTTLLTGLATQNVVNTPGSGSPNLLLYAESGGGGGSEVCFYQHADFIGAVMCRGIGGTDYPEINGLGLNDQFSSVTVPDGLLVIAYEHSGYSGRSKAFTSTTSWVGWDFNDIISSFIVIPNEVCFYQHADFIGAQMCRGIGATDWPEINSLGLNDQFSSVTVPDGLVVVAYEHGGYSGKSKTFTATTNWVGGDFNDIISSFIISIAQVCWYQHSNYDGVVFCTGLGGTDYPAINAVGLNDQFSSVQVPAGLQVVAYEHGGYSGQSRLYTGDVSWVGDDFNDIISSYYLSELQVCFFLHSDFVGDVFCGAVGDTDYPAINARGLNDHFSSVIVPEGLTVTAYEHGGFNGRSKVFSSTTNWVGWDFNDIISSFRVARV